MNSGACGYLDNSPCIGQQQGSAAAEANLTWTSAVVGAETTFLCKEATGQKDLAVAGLDKAYKINLAGHASTVDNDDGGTPRLAHPAVRRAAGRAQLVALGCIT